MLTKYQAPLLLNAAKVLYDVAAENSRIATGNQKTRGCELSFTFLSFPFLCIILTGVH
jgi:hypothetical protein